MSTDSARAVTIALLADLLLAAAKLTAFAFTGSASMLSEAVHSLADTANQALLAVGVVRSRRPPDPEHPYGYGAARYVWSLLAAAGVFFVGCGATVWHGMMKLVDPPELGQLPLAFGVLALALVVDGASFLVGLSAVRRLARAAGVPVWQYVTRGDDPSAVHVVTEDGVALLGIVIAASALGLSALTGSPTWDALGSIAIGLSMGAGAIFLIERNRRLLLGPAASTSQRTRFLEVLRRSPFVEQVKDVKSEVIGPEALRLKAEIEFDGRALARRYLEGQDMGELSQRLREPAALEHFLVEFADEIVEDLGDEVDRLEEEIRREIPESRHVDLETD